MSQRQQDNEAMLLQAVKMQGWGETKLKTDQRVLARITDGIYREPASALRELIFNAYDADATNVWIQTDAPRFHEITVADDGNGMSLEVLAYLVEHIGGSAKRTKIGSDLGIAQAVDPKLSKGGRRMIGKIGIGLFAVAQLTKHFRIVTKPRGEKFRYVVDIRLKTHSEDELAAISADRNTEFDTGDVRITREPATDEERHGTTVFLLGLKESARNLLQSRDRWVRDAAPDSLFDDDALVRQPPAFHIGSVSESSPNTIRDDEHLPWEIDDPPKKKFQKFFQAVIDETHNTGPLPDLETTCDYYFQMIWKLALAAPLEYVDCHPFLLTRKDDVRVFVLSNREKEPAKEVTLDEKQTVAQACGLSKPKDAEFAVNIDGVQLLRPIRFRNLPSRTTARLKKSLLFVAKCKLNLDKIPAEDVGGRKLSFEGYLFWTPTVVPKDNNGVILRMGDASGALFDDTFLKYEVTERTRLGQLTGELYFTEGLDAALNIDRESFNFSHPHYQFVTKWLHRALKQFANRHKAIGKELNQQATAQNAETAQRKLSDIVTGALEQIPRVRDENPAEVSFAEDADDMKEQRKEGKLTFSRSVLDDTPAAKANGRNQNSRASFFEGQMKAVAQILDAYGLLEKLNYKEQDALLRAIAKVFATEVNDDGR
jgi:hypothetical protein